MNVNIKNFLPQIKRCSYVSWNIFPLLAYYRTQSEILKWKTRHIIYFGWLKGTWEITWYNQAKYIPGICHSCKRPLTGYDDEFALPGLCVECTDKKKYGHINLDPIVTKRLAIPTHAPDRESPAESTLRPATGERKDKWGASTITPRIIRNQKLLNNLHMQMLNNMITQGSQIGLAKPQSQIPESKIDLEVKLEDGGIAELKDDGNWDICEADIGDGMTIITQKDFVSMIEGNQKFQKTKETNA